MGNAAVYGLVLSCVHKGRNSLAITGRGRPADSTGFVAAVADESVVEDKMTLVTVDKRRLILTRYEGVIYAFDATCPHAAADLAKGSLRRWRVCCHEHDYCFDIRSGRIVWPEDEVYRLRRYEVRIDDGIVAVRLSTPL